jgi:hypothetical protein
MVLGDGSDHTRVRHPSMERAVTEARRLAASNKGQRFFVLKCIGAAVIEDPVKWIHSDDALDSEIPF